MSQPADMEGADSGPLPFRELVNKHLGQPALVMVGGVDLPKQYKKAPKRNAVKISVNTHGVKLTKCDYAVFLDYNKVGPELAGGPHKRITHGKTNVDYRLTEFWHPGDSAMVACWVAYQMGCSPIIVLGMDGYAGGAYWWDEDAESNGRSIGPERHLENWHREITRNIPNANLVIRPFDGPLTTVFPKYDRKEKPFLHPSIDLPPEKVKKVVTGETVRMLRSLRLGGGDSHVEQGEVIELAYATLSKLREGRDYELYDGEGMRKW